LTSSCNGSSCFFLDSLQSQHLLLGLLLLLCQLFHLPALQLSSLLLLCNALPCLHLDVEALLNMHIGALHVRIKVHWGLLLQVARCLLLLPHCLRLCFGHSWLLLLRWPLVLSSRCCLSSRLMQLLEDMGRWGLIGDALLRSLRCWRAEFSSLPSLGLYCWTSIGIQMQRVPSLCLKLIQLR